ncbi:MAG TPA: hypothetical protein PLM59_01245 [Oscillospiraceae bacterium]|nr:hypothetical protein [Oscillospiraceae bacterium]
MSKSLSIRLKETIFSPSMCASVLIGIFLLTWNFIYNLIIYNLSVGPLTITEMASTFLDDIYSSHARGGFDLFAPVLAVLPATTLFCEDYNSGYIKSILLRANKKKYNFETLACSSIAGGLAVFLPSLISSLFFIIIGKPHLADDFSSNIFDESFFAPIQFIWGGGLVVAILLILAFIFGAVWSNIGLCISAVITNRYVTLAAPFAVYFASHLLLYRLNGLLFLSPVNMLMPIADFLPNIIYPFAYQGILLLVTFIIFPKFTERRFENV